MQSSDNTHSNSESSSRLRVPFGLKDGKMYEPRQVPLGKACGCICPSCNSPLIARHALKCSAKRSVTPHFAHQADANCVYGRESAIHLAAKQLIEEHRKLYLPDHVVRIYVVDEMGNEHKPQRTLVSAGLKVFSSVRLEQSISDFRPDLIATTVNGNDLLIEIAVTSFVDELKQKKIENYGTAAIQIDASKIPVVNFDALTKLLFEPSSNVEWLFHPKNESTKSVLHARLAPELEAAMVEAQKKEEHRIIQDRKKEEQRRIEAERQKNVEKIEHQRQAKLQEQKLQKIEEFKAMNIDEKLAFSLMCLGLDQGMIPIFLDHKVRCEGAFRVPRRNWQLAVFGAFVQKRAKYKNITFRSDEVVEWLEQRFVININPNYPHSHKVAVWDFLTSLSDLGILSHIGHRTFEVEQNDLNEIIASQYGIPPNISNINLASFYLVWEGDWPNRNQVEHILKRYERKYGAICDWEKFGSLIPDAKNRTPHEIAQIYSYRKDKTVDILLKFMVEARFIKAEKLN